jgi:hypothetical protein
VRARAQERSKIDIAPNIAHAGVVASVAFSPDGILCACAMTALGQSRAVCLFVLTGTRDGRGFERGLARCRC